MPRGGIQKLPYEADKEDYCWSGCLADTIADTISFVFMSGLVPAAPFVTCSQGDFCQRSEHHICHQQLFSRSLLERPHGHNHQVFRVMRYRHRV